KKDAADKASGRIFSRLGKEIMVAAKMGGGDVDTNPRLRSGIAAAKAANMPNANIDRAIKKGLGELGDVTFEEIQYEGYAAGGVALLIDCLTDNRNRSASEVRTTLDRNNGNLASSGSVAYMFKRQSHFVIEGENADEDKLMDLVLDAGAEDLIVEDGVAEIWGDPSAFEAIADALAAAGITASEAAVTRRPDNTVSITDVHTAEQVLKLIDKLEDLDDVQEVTGNFEIDDSIADQVNV
ncbi:MAG: YebC/PmpR family DNA-binding transcriptional regulator, partial [Lentisphaeria bacterium]|nr:YebC/PmpR family DNA-binding transcriptional regulator [Lentisphaeria bacterium]